MINGLCRRAVAAVLGTALCVAAHANLVLNPGFETLSRTPTGLSTNAADVAIATGWSTPTAATPDIFNATASSASGVSVPGNTFGSEPAHGGSGYAGMITYFDLGNSAPREYLQGSLLTPLVAGATYNVGFYVSLGDASQRAIQELGMYFAAGPVAFPLLGGPLALLPQVENAGGVVANKSGWQLLNWAYTAAGGETQVVIGNFRGNAATTLATVAGGSLPDAYYYIDDVSVEPVGGAPLAEPPALCLVLAALAALAAAGRWTANG